MPHGQGAHWHFQPALPCAPGETPGRAPFCWACFLRPWWVAESFSPPPSIERTARSLSDAGLLHPGPATLMSS